MMENLQVTEGDIIQVEYARLRIAEFAKFEPQSVDFLEISNPKAV
jgi:ubiquitin fusion degradation protein 1